MLSGVFTVLGCVLLLVVVLLSVPVVVAWRVAWPTDTDNDIELIWLFGLVRMPLPYTPGGAPSSAPERARRHAASGSARVFRAFRYKPFRSRLIRYLRRMWRLIEKSHVRLRVRVGLDDPAATGQLWAVMGPLAALLGALDSVVVRIEPDFVREALEMDSSGRVRIVPLQLLALTLALGFSLDLWRGLRLMRSA